MNATNPNPEDIFDYHATRTLKKLQDEIDTVKDPFARAELAKAMAALLDTWTFRLRTRNEL